jgi:hypothetical protein
MKKNIILGLLLLSQIASIFGQKAVAPHQKIAQFYKTTTCIVFDSDIFNTYNSAIEEAVKHTWGITPYKFISMDQFKTMMHNPKYSFLVRTKVVPEKNKTGVAYTFLSLVLGERDKNFDELTEICSFPLSYYNTDYDKYDYKMGALLLFIQNHINITYNNPDLTSRNILSFYNRNIKKIGDKTIYFTADNLAKNVNTPDKIKKYYSGRVKIVKPEVIRNLINTKDRNAIILHIVSPPGDNSKLGKCYKMLIGAGDGLLYYYNWHKVSKKKPGKFLKQDFTKLNK